MNEEELFHILHKAIELINTEREESEKILILNKELGKAAEVIMKEDFYMEEGMFPITSVSRDDIKQAFNGRDDFEVVCQILDKMDDGQMEDLASKLANDYCEQLLWDRSPISRR